MLFNMLSYWTPKAMHQLGSLLSRPILLVVCWLLGSRVLSGSGRRFCVEYSSIRNFRYKYSFSNAQGYRPSLPASAAPSSSGLSLLDAPVDVCDGSTRRGRCFGLLIALSCFLYPFKSSSLVSFIHFVFIPLATTPTIAPTYPTGAGGPPLLSRARAPSTLGELGRWHPAKVRYAY